MEIVIDISEKIYDTIMADVMPTEEQMSAIVTRVYQGTPLPKNHGRLIDADKLQRTDHIVLESTVDNAPTIIEAEGSESE